MVHLHERADKPRVFCHHRLFQPVVADPQLFGKEQGIALSVFIDGDSRFIDPVKNDCLLPKIQRAANGLSRIIDNKSKPFLFGQWFNCHQLDHTKDYNRLVQEPTGTATIIDPKHAVGTAFFKVADQSAFLVQYIEQPVRTDLKEGRKSPGHSAEIERDHALYAL